MGYSTEITKHNKNIKHQAFISIAFISQTFSYTTSSWNITHAQRKMDLNAWYDFVK